jgi:hypothetical protein
MRRPAEWAPLMPAVRRRIFPDHSRVMTECPRLISDEELADVLAAFVDQVQHGKAAVAEPKVKAAPKRTTRRKNELAVTAPIPMTDASAMLLRCLEIDRS